MAKKKLDPKLSELMSVAEATKFLKKHKTTLAYHVVDRKIKKYMRGKLTMMLRQDMIELKEYLRSLQHGKKYT